MPLYHSYALVALLQEAIDSLEGDTVPAYSHRIFEAFPESRFFLCWPKQRRRRALFTVHEMPHVVWRRTHSNDESDEHQGKWSGLADAALALLRDPNLAKAAPPSQQQQHSADCPIVLSRLWAKHSAAAAWNWESFAQCLASNVRSVIAAQRLSQQDAAAGSMAFCPLQHQARIAIIQRMHLSAIWLVRPAAVQRAIILVAVCIIKTDTCMHAFRMHTLLTA